MVVSKLRDSRNAALVTHAAGSQQDDLGTRMGLARPSFISRAAWRRALLAANSYRGLPNPTQFFLEGALSDWHVALQVVLDPSRPTQLVSPGAEFTQDLVGRMVRIAGHGLFRVVGPYDVGAAPFRNEILDLCPVATSSWQAPDWQALTAPAEVEAEFHSFHVREDQAGPSSQTIGDETGTVTVHLYPEVSDLIPPSFLIPMPEIAEGYTVDGDGYIDPQPDDDWPEGVPYGNGLLAGDELIAGPPDGPWPAFLASDELLGALAVAMRAVLSAGFKVRFLPLPQAIAIPE